MKKNFTIVCVMAMAILGFSSCMAPAGAGTAGMGAPTVPTTPTTTAPQGNAQGGIGSVLGSLTGQGSKGEQSMLGSLLSGLIGDNTPVTPKAIAGTWVYSSPECRFTTENYLAKAGGEVAASTIEGKLAEMYAKIGIAPGVCSFTFTEAGQCAITFGGRSIQGTYTLNSETRDLTITSSTGLIRLSGKIYYSFTNLAILFDASKLLQMAQMVAAFTGKGSSTIQTVSGLLSQYEGMMIGMNLTK